MALDPMALEQSQLSLTRRAAGAFGPRLIDKAREVVAGSRLLIGVWRYTPILLLALAWEAATRLGLISHLVMPPLDQVLAAWWNLLISGDLIRNGVVSLSRAAAGLGLAIVCGVTLGVLMAWYKPVRVVFNPLVQAVYPMPKSALIPVVVLWLGFGSTSKIVLIFIGCMLPVTLTAFNGARGAEQVLIWSARSLGASRTRTLIEIVLPSALPEILAGIRTAMAFAFVLMVATRVSGRVSRSPSVISHLSTC